MYPNFLRKTQSDEQLTNYKLFTLKFQRIHNLFFSKNNCNFMRIKNIHKNVTF